jgi:hypothetical protein
MDAPLPCVAGFGQGRSPGAGGTLAPKPNDHLSRAMRFAPTTTITINTSAIRKTTATAIIACFSLSSPARKRPPSGGSSGR